MRSPFVPLLALLAMGACASTPPDAVHLASRDPEVAPCKTFDGNSAPERTLDFGRCLSMADSVASQHKPTAESPDATHWGLPMTQGFVDATARPTVTGGAD